MVRLQRALGFKASNEKKARALEDWRQNNLTAVFNLQYMRAVTARARSAYVAFGTFAAKYLYPYHYGPPEMKSTLRQYMSAKQLDQMQDLPTWHSTCIEKTGVARPGKTNRDRKRRG